MVDKRVSNWLFGPARARPSLQMIFCLTRNNIDSLFPRLTNLSNVILNHIAFEFVFPKYLIYIIYNLFVFYFIYFKLIHLRERGLLGSARI